MKKILVITRFMGLGGTEKVILQLCQAFKDSYSITVVSSGGCLITKLDSLGIRHFEIPDICHKNLSCLFSNLNFFKRLFSSEHFDIIHTHHRMAAWYVAHFHFENTKLIHTMHNVFHNQKLLTRYALKKFTIVACGKQVYSNLVNFFGFSKEKIQLIENGVDNVFFRQTVPQIDQAKENHLFVFGFVGRICKIKGYDLLLQSIAALKKKKDNFIVFFIGDGESRKRAEAWVQSHQLENCVSFVGYQPNSLNYISLLDCLILPSREEGLPLTIIEAMALQTLVLCSDIPENSELIQNNISGITFVNGSALDLSIKMEEVMSLDAAKMKNTAYLSYRDRYCLAAFISKYKALFSKL
jgi:glycosyltransferase involved in cell wall biosynthesis